MNFVDIILDKRYGRALSDEQIDFFIKSVTDKTVPDYQVSALLMAIVLNGMDDREMTTLTMKMASSGEMNDLSFVDGIAVDKHSTGGVGDKITPIVLPLCATFGVPGVKLSGRGLGFTGGTVDKFESVKGFNVQVSQEDFPKYLEKSGMVISGQTPSLAPADKILYALRDVTGTVDSIPLIASSIMSKKIAGGAQAIVLDVTCGSGAFMKTEEDARKLASAMIRIGNLAGRKTVAVITNMDEPLGKAVGNVLEMQEVHEVLLGRGSSDVVEVACALASRMITLAGKNDGMSIESLEEECKKRIQDGTVLAKYYELIISQGGNILPSGAPEYVEKPFEDIRVPATQDGYIKGIQADVIGKASVMLGAGRLTKEDKIDYGAGICFYRKVGDKVKRGDVICSLYRGESVTPDDEKLFDAMEMISDAITYSSEIVEPTKAVIDVLD
ncbi:MAG: thymidine phosphorylase [Saccharofermentans sp.]|nr:thymidine phosphorylase [Saccharofermentans sp.]